MKFMEENLKYGFTYRNKVYTDSDQNFGESMDKFYKLRTGEDLVKSGFGVCRDFCEFERLFFEEMKIPHECYFFISFYKGDVPGRTHTFALFEQKGKCYWFEYAWNYFKGIWEYNSKEEALKDVLDKFNKYTDRPYEWVEIYRFPKAKAGLNSYTFVGFCMEGEEVKIK